MLDASVMRRSERQRAKERARSEALLVRADAIVAEVDDQLERLKLVAEQYRQRRMNEGEAYGI